MYISQPKISFNRTQHTVSFSNKENIVPLTKLNVFPPKIHRVSSIGSGLQLQQTLHTSLSKQFKPYRDYSRGKDEIYIPKSSINKSFNVNYDSKDFNSMHRYSCNIDIDKNSDYVKSSGPLYTSYQRRASDLDLQSKVRELQQKMKKVEQNQKYYSQEIQHFKIQFSSSTSNLLDSINTNVLTVSTREPLKQTTNMQNFSNIQNISNKQNVSKHMIQVDSVTNSPKDSQMEKKLKQIDQMRKQIKKVVSREEIMKGDMKTFQLSVKQAISDFKEYIQQSTQGLVKMQQKHKKKMFDKIAEEMDKKFKEFVSTQFEPIKNAIQNMKTQQLQAKSNIKISKSTQKFIKDPILIKIKEQVYGLIKKVSNLSPFQSYEDMIKRNIYQAIGKPSSSSGLINNNFGLKQNEEQNHSKISFESAETTYYIDEEGYLLDSEGYYLLDNEQKIKLDSVQLEKLEQNKILQEVSKIN